jgi:PAS domain S-box-containing protein
MPARRSDGRSAESEGALLYREVARVEHERWLDARLELEAARDYFRALFNAAPIGLATLTPSGVFLEINETGAAILGDDSGHIVGKPLLAYVQKSDTNILLGHLRQCRAGIPIVVTELALRFRGEPRPPVQLTSRRLDLSAGPVYYTSIADISARRQSEHALKVSERLYREIVETANEGIGIVNVDNCVTFVNRRFARMLGHEVGDLLGRPMTEIVADADLPRERAMFDGRGGFLEPVEIRLRRADGDVIWTGVSRSVLHDDEGRFSGMLRMYTDITDRKEHDAERERLVTQLATAQEAERRRIARELHDQIGQHIVGFALGLKRLSSLGSGSAFSESVRKLEEVTALMARDVHHIALELRPTALDDLGLPDALAFYARDLGRRHALEMDVHSDPNARLGSTAETVVYRIAQEALTNVVKHAGASRVSVLLERRANTVQLIVEDDGSGFDADRLLNFGSLEHRLGLAGMNERAALVGGELQIESAPGRGTTLILRVEAPRSNGPERRVEEGPGG